MSVRAKKRFYADVGMVSSSSGGDHHHYEITLDSKKAKTPGGSPLSASNESLARALVHEWNSQADLVMPSRMHLTGLCCVCIDNPSNSTKEDLVDGILSFLDTDTLLFFDDGNGNGELRRRQADRWQPIVDWFCRRYDVDVRPSASLVAGFGPTARETVRNHLLSYGFEAVQGFGFGVDAVKSVILMMAVADGRLTATEAVRLSRLEVEFQTEFWGNVEWAHDLELHDTSARVSAAALFIHCNSSQSGSRTK